MGTSQVSPVQVQVLIPGFSELASEPGLQTTTFMIHLQQTLLGIQICSEAPPHTHTQLSFYQKIHLKYISPLLSTNLGHLNLTYSATPRSCLTNLLSPALKVSPTLYFGTLHKTHDPKFTGNHSSSGSVWNCFGITLMYLAWDLKSH